MLVRNLVLDFSRRGHQCHVVYISDAAGLGASASYEQAFKEALAAAGIGYTELGHSCRRNLPLGAWRLRRSVRSFRPDVVHMHLGYGLLFQSLGLIRVPTVYTNHNIIFRFSSRLFWLFNRFVDRYVAICHACADMLKRHTDKPIILIYNGVPSGFSKGGARHGYAFNPEVLSVGDLTPQKDYPTLLAAAECLVGLFRAQGRDVRFSIAGSGAERASLEGAIRGRGLERNVRLLGTRRDVPDLMAQADLLILASRWEGLPITLIEAATCGLPAIATDVGGSGEVVLDGVTGRLVAPGDPDGLAAAAYAVLSDQVAYDQMSQAAINRGAQFTLASCADAHLALYADLVQQATRRKVRD